MKYDLIHEVLRVIRDKNLKRRRNFGFIGFFGDMGTGMILAKNRKKTVFVLIGVNNEVFLSSY